jgi:hypothetical protein
MQCTASDQFSTTFHFVGLVFGMLLSSPCSSIVLNISWTFSLACFGIRASAVSTRDFAMDAILQQATVQKDAESTRKQSCKNDQPLRSI